MLKNRVLFCTDLLRVRASTIFHNLFELHFFLFSKLYSIVPGFYGSSGKDFSWNLITSHLILHPLIPLLFFRSLLFPSLLFSSTLFSSLPFSSLPFSTISLCLSLFFPSTLFFSVFFPPLLVCTYYYVHHSSHLFYLSPQGEIKEQRPAPLRHAHIQVRSGLEYRSTILSYLRKVFRIDLIVSI